MKKMFLLTICCLVLFHIGAQTFPQRENIHRLMTFNIHHGEGMDGEIDIFIFAFLKLKAKGKQVE
ncbi:MAG: hypothetical protein XD92_0364 [Proteiniphilum acetatigenes]|uniref:Endonuclease n=1 Tax=Proteiniphilum acetatigenes TaxID=294710 RepID=A0A101HKW4_9BACT|nr:MAG: hypothetical protein XD92_0364 [Proteiniphilum acetatigenes]